MEVKCVKGGKFTLRKNERTAAGKIDQKNIYVYIYTEKKMWKMENHNSSTFSIFIHTLKFVPHD